MELNGVPNDIIQNLNPISIVIFVPLMDFVVYPALRKAKINFTPIKRIALGFALASVAMIASCVIQVYVSLYPRFSGPARDLFYLSYRPSSIPHVTYVPCSSFADLPPLPVRHPRLGP